MSEVTYTTDKRFRVIVKNEYGARELCLYQFNRAQGTKCRLWTDEEVSALTELIRKANAYDESCKAHKEASK